MTPLERAIEVAGGVAALASAINVAPSAPSMWKKREKVPAEHCPAIERVTRRRAAEDPTVSPVTCEELRPDVAWDVLREPANDAPDTTPGALDEPAVRQEA